MWLNLYGHQAVRRKIEKGVETQKIHLQGILRAKNPLYKKIIQFVEEFLSRLGETGFIFIYS